MVTYPPTEIVCLIPLPPGLLQMRYQRSALDENRALRSLGDKPPVSFEKASSNVSNSEYSQSTGKLDANMHRSVPNASMVASTHGRKSSGVHLCITIPTPLIFTAALGDLANRWIPSRHAANVEGSADVGQPVCSSTNVIWSNR